MRAVTRSPSPADTVFGSDDEINVASTDTRRQPMRRNSSATTLADSTDSHEKASRTIILCLEGSDQRFGVDYAKDFMSLLEKGISAQQKVYCNHQRGRRDTSRKLIEKQLLESYEWLVNNYKPNDKICILGYAQGANAARKLCGMIDKVGLLPSGNHEQIKFAHKHFQNAGSYPRTAREFKETYSVGQDGQDIMIDFLGLWDTSARYIPAASPNPSIRFLRQALLIKRTRSNDWPRLAEKVACHLQLRPEGETPLQWMTKECLLAHAGVKLRKIQNPVGIEELDGNLQMKDRVFRYFSMPVA